MMLLNFRTRWSEHKYIIVSCIRMLAINYYTPQAIRCMGEVSRKLKTTECNGGTISDERLYELYVQEVEKDEISRCVDEKSERSVD